MAVLNKYYYYYCYSLILTILFPIFVKLFILKKKQNRKRKFNLPPSPPKLPIIGNLHQLGLTNPHISLQNLSQKYGPIIYLDLGQVPTVIISSPILAKEAFKTNDLALSNRPKTIAAKYFLYNCSDMVFSPYGAYWRYVRKLCTFEIFGAKRVQSFGLVRQREVARLVRRLAEPFPGTVNLTKTLALYANDVICRVAFGQDFSESGDFDRKGFHNLLHEFQELFGGLSVADFFPSMEFMLSLTGMKSRLVKTFERFEEIFDKIISDHLKPRIGKVENVKDLVDLLLDIQRNESGEMPLTMDNVKGLIMDMFVAGTDTMLAVLDWAMTELILNPQLLKKVQTEIRNVLGKRRVVLESDLPKLNYMKAVIKETFRLHPPAPILLPRETIEPVSIGGYDIPAKTRIFFNVWAMGRDPNTWEEPEKFKPERFLGSLIDFKGQDFELIPFGAGRRICPAITFGMAAIELALAQILYSFDWELPRGVKSQDLDMTEVFGVTMYRKCDLEVLAKLSNFA